MGGSDGSSAGEPKLPWCSDCNMSELSLVDRGSRYGGPWEVVNVSARSAMRYIAIFVARLQRGDHRPSPRDRGSRAASTPPRL